MLSKLSPVLLISTSVGGGLLIAKYGFRDFRVSSVISITDDDYLRDRNLEAFKIDQSNTSLGSVWKNTSVGSIYKDDTYFVFQDWSWLNGVKINSKDGDSFSGGENLKNYVSGIGFEVLNVNNKDNWKEKEWERSSDIKLKRVLISNDEGYKYGGGYKLFERSSCLLGTSNKSATTGPQIYLLIGWAKGGTAKDDGKRPRDFELVNGYTSFCDWYEQGKYSYTKKDSISVSFNLTDGKTITGKEFPVIADSKSFRPLYFKNSQQQIIHPIVLGVAIKGHMRAGQVGKRAGDRLTKEQATKAIQSKISDGIVGIYDKENRKNMIGLQIKEKSQQIRGETTEESWITDIKATFKYQYN